MMPGRALVAMCTAEQRRERHWSG